VAAHVNVDRAIKRTNPALHTAGRIGHHLSGAGGFVTGGLVSEKILDSHNGIGRSQPKKVMPSL
jgi:hypothetical protein